MKIELHCNPENQTHKALIQALEAARYTVDIVLSYHTLVADFRNRSYSGLHEIMFSFLPRKKLSDLQITPSNEKL